MATFVVGSRDLGQLSAAELLRLAGFYLAPAIAVAAPLAWLGLTRRDLQREGLLMLGCVAGVVLGAEGCQRFADARGDRERLASAARTHGFDLDTRDLAEVLRDLRARGVDAAAARRPIWSARGLTPLGYAPEKTVVVCNEVGQWLVYETDAHGFNNPRHAWSSEARLLFVGDSFVEGYCWPGNRGFVEHIREQVPDTLNLGVGGNGPLLVLASLVEFLPDSGAGDVLWFFYEGNDFRNMTEHLDHPLLRRYLEDGFSQDLAARAPEIARIMEPFAEAESSDRRNDWRSWARLTALRARLGLRVGGKRFDWGAFERVVARASRLACDQGARIHFLLLPDQEPSAPRAQIEMLEEVVRARGIPFHDLGPVLRTGEDPAANFSYPTPPHGHLSAQGNERLADFLLREVLAEGAPRGPDCGS